MCSLCCAQSCPTLCDPMDCSPPGFSVHGFFQARILEWVAIPFSRRSSWPRDWTLASCIGRQIPYHLSHLSVNIYGLPQLLSGKESAFNAGDVGLIPGLRRSLREGNGNPLQYSFLENAMDSLAGYNPLSHKELDMPEHIQKYIYILFVLYVCTYITQFNNMYMSIYMSCMYMCVYMYKTALLCKCICVKDPAE